VRFSLFVAIAVVLVGVGGCYSPGIKNKGFACSPAVEPPCPSGFFCVDGLCQDKPGTSSGVGGVGGDAGSGGDLSMSTSGGGDKDLSTSSSYVDMATEPDLRKPACYPASTSCLTNDQCCSLHCTPLFGCD
jgi:hypothetical protein